VLGPHLVHVADDTEPTHHVRCFLTAAIGVSIATAEREDVLCEDTTFEYEYEGAGAPPQHVQLAGFCRFQCGLDEIKACAWDYGTDANLLAREIIELEVRTQRRRRRMRRP